MSMRINKYSVPYHCYRLSLVDGTEVTMDVGYEEDWGHVQQCLPDDCEDWEDSVGWGNDAEGHIKIVGVIDCATSKPLKVRQWAERCVWPYVDNYSLP